jgi:hypothetical protein
VARLGLTHSFKSTIGSPIGLVVPGNIDLEARPVVRRSGGVTATVASKSFGYLDQDKSSPTFGKTLEVLLPTISDDGKDLTDIEAKGLYERTGRHLGKFLTSRQATGYAKKLSKDQAEFYKGIGLITP